MSREGERVGEGACFWVTLPASRLGVPWRYAICLPLRYHQEQHSYPVLYLFRGAASEWLGRQDHREGLLKVLWRLTASGLIAPLLVVLPGFMPPGQTLLGAPINWSEPGEDFSVGHGCFEDHFFEVKRDVERRFRVRRGSGSTALDGFSMGGYAALLLALRHPHSFGSVGAFDGSFMWRGQMDRRGEPGCWDRLWFQTSCAPFFRRWGSWDLHKMEAHNPVTILEGARGRQLQQIRKIRFHVRTVAEERHGNVDRTRRLVAALEAVGAANSFSGASLSLGARARHTWKWADIHLAGTLPLHDRVFKQGGL